MGLTPGRSTPTIGSDGRVYAGFSSALHCYTPEGILEWAYPDQSKAFSRSFKESVLINDGVLYGFDGWKFHAIKVKSRGMDRAWTGSVGNIRGDRRAIPADNNPRFLSWKMTRSREMQITLSVEPGLTFNLERSTDFSAWEVLVTDATENGIYFYIDKNVLLTEQGFYRIRTN